MRVRAASPTTFIRKHHYTLWGSRAEGNTLRIVSHRPRPFPRCCVFAPLDKKMPYRRQSLVCLAEQMYEKHRLWIITTSLASYLARRGKSCISRMCHTFRPFLNICLPILYAIEVSHVQGCQRGEVVRVCSCCARGDMVQRPSIHWNKDRTRTTL